MNLLNEVSAFIVLALFLRNILYPFNKLEISFQHIAINLRLNIKTFVYKYQ